MQIARWFGLITQQAIRRGSFRSVKDLNLWSPSQHDRGEPNFAAFTIYLWVSILVLRPINNVTNVVDLV